MNLLVDVSQCCDQIIVNMEGLSGNDTSRMIVSWHVYVILTHLLIGSFINNN